MKVVRLWFFSLLLVLLAALPTIYAQEAFNVKLILNGNNMTFSEILVDYEITPYSAEEVSSGTVQANGLGEIFFDLKPSFYKFLVGINEPSTPGFDYFGRLSARIESDASLQVTMFPVGSLRLLVTDALNSPMSYTLVKIDCSDNRGQQGYFRTDDFGLVDAKYLPVGKCVVRAAFEDFVVSKDVDIETGSRREMKLVFSDYRKSSGLSLWWFVPIFVLILGLLFLFIRDKNMAGKRHHKSANKSTDSDSSSDSGNSSKEDIITALSDPEKKVVRFMLGAQETFVEKGNKRKNFYVNQAKIVYGAGIPKTTLVRLFQSLEKKQIIIVEKVGKMKKIRFSAWFDSK